MTNQIMHCEKCLVAVTVTAQCNCGMRYITAGEAAARAVAAHPERSDRSIAKEIGVGNKTVSRARKATVSNDTVGSNSLSGAAMPAAAAAFVQTAAKRRGDDGKMRSMPKYKHTPEVRQQVASKVLDDGKTWDEVRKEEGVSATVIRTAVAHEEGKREALDAIPLSKAAEQKLETLERQLRKQLEAEYQAKLDHAISTYEWEQVFPLVKQYRDEAQKIITAQRKGIWNKKQFMLVMQCVHPDHANADLTTERNQAVRLLNYFRNVLVTYKPDDPARPKPPPLPQTPAQWEIIKRKVAEERRQKRQAAKAATDNGMQRVH